MVFSRDFHGPVIFARHSGRVRRALAFAACVALVLAVRLQSGASGPIAVRAPLAAVPDGPAQRGRVIYERYGCGMCHGADGKGGFANPNAETDGKVPGVTFVAEGYTPAELQRLILDGTPNIGRADPKGPRPPYRMPGWRGRMTDEQAGDLVRYLTSLYPKSAGEKWR